MFQEGTPWIENLTVSDPYVLPGIFLTANLVNIYLHSRNRPSVPVQSKLQTALPWIFSGGIVCISVLACYVPSVSFHAITNFMIINNSAELFKFLGRYFVLGDFKHSCFNTKCGVDASRIKKDP